MILAYSVAIQEEDDLERLRKLAMYIPVEVNFTNSNIILENLTLEITDKVSEVNPHVVGIRGHITGAEEAKSITEFLEKIIMIGEELRVNDILLAIADRDDIKRLIISYEVFKEIFDLLACYRFRLSFELPNPLLPTVYSLMSEFLGGVFKLSINFSYNINSINEVRLKILDSY
ncbi:MAG: hypothetical protein DRJ41_05065, partial [Thermoprotei archaeon]